MDKPKYSLSKSGVDKLMNQLELIAQSEVTEEVEGLLEAQLTTAFVRRMTLVKGLDDVVNRNERLSNTYQGFLNMYGFDSMYDMYIYAMSCDVVPEPMRKAKDYSKLVPVKRKIMRNGRETEVTVYEDPNKDNKDSDKDSGSTGSGRGGSGSSGGTRHARDLTTAIIGGKEETKPKDVAKIKVAAKGLPKGNKPFDEGSHMYLTVTGEEGTIEGVVGYSEDGDFLVMDFYRTSGEVSGVAAHGFFQLIRLAHEKGKGVKVEDNQQARAVYMQSGLTQQDSGEWTITSDDLQKVFGESGNKSD